VLTKGMLNKLLHAPMAYLRSDASENGKASLPQIQDLFQLGEKSGRGRGRR
jgi:glutamyl-tRNA reductase